MVILVKCIEESNKALQEHEYDIVESILTVLIVYSMNNMEDILY